MNRRKYLVSTASVLSIALAGCTNSVSSQKTPEEVSEAYMQALFDGNPEEARSLTTADASEEVTDAFVAEVHASAERSDVEIISVEPVTEGETEYTTDVQIIVDTPLGSQTSTTRVELVKQDGGWLVSSTENI